MLRFGVDPFFIDPLIFAAAGGIFASRRKKNMAKQAEIAFIRAMIPHHEDAVQRAREVILRGATGKVLALARGIIKAQTAEIAEMRAWLVRNG